MKNRVACNYTVLRFLPYPESEEFVNLGIAMACPDLHWFDFRLETRRVERITGFFPELKHNKDAFIEGRRLFKEELERVRGVLHNGYAKGQPQFKELARQFNQTFLTLVRPREEAFCFSNPRTCLVDDPDQTLDALFEYYVERGFAQRPEYQEKQMEHRLREVFSARKILEHYMDYTFAGDLCTAHFPFVRQHEKRFTRAIRPLDLDKPEPHQIVTHADAWKSKLIRMKSIPERPEQALFVVRQPESGKRRDVSRQMCKELEEVGAIVLPKEDQNGILDFAEQL
ncbi:MAG: DUF3037 domain-containing protein [Lentisphaerae bacterium]|jgi:hypothetical protein|nr:DUF3037 domain-containing protein [Lentisphaerota bacterium]